MTRIPFTKAQGAGNDFLILENNPSLDLSSAEWRRRICDRHYGVGADGILLVTVPAGDPETDADLRIFNSDGGEVEISGNGTRCAAAYLVETRGLGPRLLIRTGAGPKALQLISQQDNRFELEMEMGAPILSAPMIPFRPDIVAAGSPLELAEPVVGFSLPLSSGSRAVTVTSMGNPHCSLQVEDFDWDWQAVGAEIERHPYFPKRTNVEFYRTLSRNEIEVRYWERGVGPTLSSGTGSCGAAVAAILNRKVESPVTVTTLAGQLAVQWDKKGVTLRGPATIVCRGEYFCSHEGFQDTPSVESETGS